VSVPVLHVVATDEAADRPSFAFESRDILVAGGTRVALHLRLRRASARAIYSLAEDLAEVAANAGAWCVVNERLDVALSAGAQAVQLGHGAVPVSAARRLGRSTLAIGASVHSVEEARSRVREGADYLVAGTVYATPTHPEVEPAGLGLIASCSREVVAVIGIGGIGPGNASHVLRAGAAGVAVVRAVWDASDPVAASAELLEILSRAEGARTDARRPAGATGTSEGV